jgi:two-component system nitrogen regulation sensor histidine kinase NtrY
MSEPEPIRVAPADTRERKRRQRELWLALGGFLLVLVLSVIELRFVAVDSYLFLVVFNFNFLLLLVVLFVVARNVVKLVLERRRRVLGSRLRTRLVMAFMSLSLVPTVLMFLIAVKFVQTGIDYWFKIRVEDTLEKSLEVGQDYYSLTREQLRKLGVSLVEDLSASGLDPAAPEAGEFMSRRAKQFGAGLVGLIRPGGEQHHWRMGRSFTVAWPEIAARIDWPALKEQPGFWSTVYSLPDKDLVVGLVPVDAAGSAYLALGQNLGRGLMARLDQIVRGVEEYKKLSAFKYPLKVALYMTLGLLTASLILGSMWFGIRLAKELSAPVQALADGTQRIARGDLSVRLVDQSSDELGFLVQSFNRMAEDLQGIQGSLRRANLQLEQQNQELEARGSYMEAVLNNITAGVISLDASGRVSTVNRAAEAMLGLDARDILGREPADLSGPFAELYAELRDRMARMPGFTWQRQVEVAIGSREVKFLVNMVALTGAEGRNVGVVALFEDITELEKMQRLAAWREVARRIAHEIKNPLTPIKLSAQRLERKFAGEVGDPAFRECTGLIVRQVEHMQQMVQEFSSFAKLPEVVPQPDELSPLVAEVVTLFRLSHSRIRWELKDSGDLGTSRFDREAIRRVLINLLTNAAEALDDREDGLVEVDLSRDPLLNLVRLEVRDNGPGLNAEERSRLFEPYFSRKKGGTGLGLTIARSIVSDHHGYIRVRANEPRGTVFIIELPIT